MLILALLLCVDRFGACNDLKTQLDQCFEAEKRVKRKAALAKARPIAEMEAFKTWD